MGATIPVFDGTGDVGRWVVMIKAKLMAKGYKEQLLDANRPQNTQNQIEWDKSTDKALGLILMHIDPDITIMFEDKQTPQTLLEEIWKIYCPDVNQEIDRLENELMSLTYDGTDPILWTVYVREIVFKLIIRSATPTDRTVRRLVLQALEKEPEYKIRVEIIRQLQSELTLNELWSAIKRFPYPLKEKNKVVCQTTSCKSKVGCYITPTRINSISQLEKVDQIPLVSESRITDVNHDENKYKTEILAAVELCEIIADLQLTDSGVVEVEMKEKGTPTVLQHNLQRDNSDCCEMNVAEDRKELISCELVEKTNKQHVVEVQVEQLFENILLLHAIHEIVKVLIYFIVYTWLKIVLAIYWVERTKIKMRKLYWYKFNIRGKPCVKMKEKDRILVNMMVNIIISILSILFSRILLIKEGFKREMGTECLRGMKT